MAQERINLTPYFERIFSIADMSSDEALDILCEELEKGPDVSIFDVPAMEAVGKRVRKRIAALRKRKGKPVWKATSGKGKPQRQAKS